MTLENSDRNFFLEEELAFFNTWGYQVYNQNDEEHVAAKKYLMRTVWQKTEDWSNKVINALPGYAFKAKKVWSQKGWGLKDGKNSHVTRFKYYTWAKIYPKEFANKNIFFTIGLSAVDYKFEIKLDFKRSNSKLNKVQNKICLDYLNQNDPKPLNIAFSPSLSWDQIVQAAITYINENEASFFLLIDLVWNSSFLESFLERTAVNYALQARRSKIIGSIGEEIVLGLERQKVKQIFPTYEMKVQQVKDSYGFDIVSFNNLGHQIFIEVKSTTLSLSEPFYMSANQKDTLEREYTRYFIYRIYDLNVLSSPPTYKLKILSTQSSDLVFEAIEYKVSIDSSNNPINQNLNND